jgi:flagellar protein FliO/FliZ
MTRAFELLNSKPRKPFCHFLTRKTALILQGIVLIALAPEALAAEPVILAPSSSSFGGMVWFTFICLMLGAGLLGLLAWLIRRNKGLQAPNADIQIVLQQAIGPRERVIVMKVLDRVLVIGQTPHQISLLTELEPEEIADLSSRAAPPDMKATFAQLLKGKI